MLEKATQSVDSDLEKLLWSLRTSASRPRLWNEVGGSPFRPVSQFSSFKAALAHSRSGCSCSVAMKNSEKRVEARGGAPFCIPLQEENPYTSCCWEEHPYTSHCRGAPLRILLEGGAHLCIPLQGSTLTHPIAGGEHSYTSHCKLQEPLLEAGKMAHRFKAQTILERTQLWFLVSTLGIITTAKSNSRGSDSFF